jgi:mannose-6-phosphate isomerase-like protein (cupin superfamily)
MNKQPTPSTCVVPPSGGRVIRAFGDEITVHLGAAETGGKYTMFTDVTPPGGGPPPHYHQNEDEWFFVLEGRAEFFKDNVWIEVPVGTAVFTPRGVVHAFRNPGDKPLRQLIQTAPSGFETFFARCAEEFAKPGPPDMKRIIEISTEHGIHFVNA